MKDRFGRIVFLAMLLCLVGVFDASAQQSDEDTIKQIAQTMQEGWNKKDGKMFASPFAEEHDYVNINGLYLPNIKRDGNGRAHQGLFDGPYKETDLQLRVAKVKFLSPEIAIMHIQGHSHPKGKPEEKREELVITGVVHKRAGKWEVVAFQNTPSRTPGGGKPPAQPAPAKPARE